MNRAAVLLCAGVALLVSSCYSSHVRRAEGAGSPDGAAAGDAGPETPDSSGTALCGTEATVVRIAATDRCVAVRLDAGVPTVMTLPWGIIPYRPTSPGRLLRVYNDGTTALDVSVTIEGPCGCELIVDELEPGLGCAYRVYESAGSVDVSDPAPLTITRRIEPVPVFELVAYPLVPVGAPMLATVCRVEL